MLESGSSLPLRFRLLNAVGRTLGAEKLTFARFDEELLREAAVKETGLTDFGDPYHRDGLLQLLQSAEEDADLHFVGRLAYRELIINALASRLQLIEARKRTSPGRVFDVHYKRLVADPIRAVRDLRSLRAWLVRGV